jgi:hypothetical protein
MFDSDVALAQIRELIKTICGTELSNETRRRLTRELVDIVAELDRYLRSGGDLPTDWRS